MCQLCAKGFLDSDFNEAVFDKKANFQEIASNLTYSQTFYFLKYDWKLTDQLLLPYKFNGSDVRGIYFFIFASCEPLIKTRMCSGDYLSEPKSFYIEIT